MDFDLLTTCPLKGTCGSGAFLRKNNHPGSFPLGKEGNLFFELRFTLYYRGL
ncbi:hypothetical protein DBT_2423 [Dissulfuribacter thermophilus]|uniref:Uncharacterized protein n=1 Tax=Dissulfuribacter thermophilus TaxID=1156395 RepID=A0A1B9F2K5_9BACT|nr:hypothetical protein DBT_2423 [Dissulfuribacter thermophilus]